ncbi:MAG: hypothetical protein ISR77_26215 [Pirellulaceae bacterium]|nr:hypothetical protein [Pirellulaceae bacterium]
MIPLIVARFATCCFLVFALNACATAAIGAQSGIPVADEIVRIEREFGRPLADVVRLQLWSRYGTTDRFATYLGITRQQLDELFKVYQWELMHPPALRFQNGDIPESFVRASTDVVRNLDGFVGRNGGAASPSTRAVVACDRYTITVSITCDEHERRSMVARTPAQDQLPPKERAYWDGDLVPLKGMLFQGTRISDEQQWARQLQPPDTSVLLDDCVVIFLTPTVIGKDLSHLELAHLAPDPAKILSELHPLEDQRVFLEGAFYFIAVNPNGAVLDVFYDPWGGGIFCPAWHSGAKVSTSITGDKWEAKVQIPLKSLQPNVNEDSIWAVDLCRIRRSGAQPAEVTRSRETTFIKYDFVIPARQPPAFPPLPTVSVEPLPQSNVDGPFPTAEDWSRATLIRGLSGPHPSQASQRNQVRLTHDEQHLFIRFDCQEQDIARLKVVTREQEEQAYGKEHRRSNFLDRRESWGLDWGDYVEVLLAPDLKSADPFHAGLFQFMVNSQGDLLQRHYDTFGMFTVSPHPSWDSGAQVRVNKAEDAWSVELAIPFDALCTSVTVPTRWGLNLHRCISAGNTSATDADWLWGSDSAVKPPRGQEIHLRWSDTDAAIRDARRLGTMRIDARKVKSTGANQPKPAPGRADGPRQEPLTRNRESDRLASICFVDATHGWAVGGRGTILHTTDGGSTWKEQSSGTNFILEDIVFLDHKHGWAVGGWPRDCGVAIYGGVGVILATNDGGNTWRRQLDATAAWLSAVYFIDPSNGWAVGEHGTVMRTQDGGNTWIQMRNVPTPAWLNGLHFVDQQRGWAVGRYETVLKTEDGGQTWTHQPTPTPHRPFSLPMAYEAVRFASDREGWTVGEHGNIFHTDDGGKTWSKEAIDLPESVLDFVNISDLTTTQSGNAWAVSPVGVLVRSPDGSGTTWRLAKTGVPAWLRCVSFIDDNNGWVAGDRNTLIHTTDGGKTWTRQRDSGRRMGLLYATPHDHHINGSAMGMLNEEFDNAYVLFGRVLRPFIFGGDMNSPKNDAATMALGVAVTYNFNEFSWRGRDNPHRIAERYQHHGGIEPMERRLVAMIRTLRPEILVGEQPVVQEGYYAHGVGEIARAVVAAFDSAGDPNRFPELRSLGLEPFTPKKLYLTSMWPNQIYPIHAPTLRIPPVHKFSERLGMTYGEASLTSRQVFWGLLDRGRPPAQQKPWPGQWTLHLKQSRVKAPDPERDIFDGIR